MVRQTSIWLARIFAHEPMPGCRKFDVHDSAVLASIRAAVMLYPSRLLLSFWAPNLKFLRLRRALPSA